MGCTGVMTMGRGEAGFQGGKGTEVQAASKANGARSPSSAGRMRPVEESLTGEVKGKGCKAVILLGC